VYVLLEKYANQRPAPACPQAKLSKAKAVENASEEDRGQLAKKNHKEMLSQKSKPKEWRPNTNHLSFLHSSWQHKTQGVLF
jgi:hypothetical protein